MSENLKLASARVHFIGIGGIGMCGLAELLHNMGAQVTGSDLGTNEQTQYLQDMGVQIFRGHRAEHLGDAEVVVYSSAVKEDNPEYVAARQAKIPLIRRAEALAEIMRLKRGLAVAGTHGKTTTTSLVASVFISANMDPTVVVGGRLDLIKSTAVLGQGEWLIAEADESDGSFNRLAPEVVIVTNVDDDHLDHYKDIQTLENAFFDFASRIPFYGALIVWGDDHRTRQVFQNFSKKILYYGTHPDNDFVLSGGQGEYSLTSGDQLLGCFRLSTPGLYNALNATAAIVAGLEAGIPFEQCASGIEAFQGVDRRFEHKGCVNGVDFYDDYGHHPTEIMALLSGFKEKFPDRRKVVLFQPHRYSRTQLCWEQFLTCFNDADCLYVMDVYAAGEATIQGVSSKGLSEEIQHAHCQYWSKDLDPDLAKLKEQLRPGDVFLTLGAGDVYKIGEALMG